MFSLDLKIEISMTLTDILTASQTHAILKRTTNTDDHEQCLQIDVLGDIKGIALVQIRYKAAKHESRGEINGTDKFFSAKLWYTSVEGYIAS
jgi:hypothetical protein